MADLLRTSWLLYRMHVASVARSLRTLLLLVLSGIPPVIAFLVTRFSDDAPAEEVLGILGGVLTLQVIVPLVCLIAGAAVVTEEIENRTITYVFTRPVHRAALFLGRWLATATLVVVLLGGAAVLLVVFTAGGKGDLPDGMGARVIVAVLCGALVYSMLAAVLGVFLKRPIIVGLGYAVAVEGFIANVPGSTQALSVQYYLRGIVVDKTREFWREAPIPFSVPDFHTPSEAVLRLAIALVLAAALGAWGIARRQYVLTA